MAGQPKDARIAGPKHLDFRAAAQSELFKLVDVVRVAEHGGNTAAVAYGKPFQGDSLSVGCFIHRLPSSGSGTGL